MSEYTYKIRPHHGMCLSFFQGKGYSDEFVKNMTNIKRELAVNPLIYITCGTDDVCAICPNNVDGVCATAEKVAQYDNQVLLKCNISEGDVMPFLEFERLVCEKILHCGKRKEICGNCQWDSLC